jgi:hypothetical protein
MLLLALSLLSPPARAGDPAFVDRAAADFDAVPGTVVCCQYWARDTLAHGSLLSDALAFLVDP